jgi:hypothetical protein
VSLCVLMDLSGGGWFDVVLLEEDGRDRAEVGFGFYFRKEAVTKLRVIKAI